MYLPLISQFSATTQLLFLTTLLVISFLHKGFRMALFGLILAYVGFKIIIPIGRWGFYIFKYIALFGFYLHFFSIGIGFILTGFGLLSEFGDRLKWLSDELDGRGDRERR